MCERNSVFVFVADYEREPVAAEFVEPKNYFPPGLWQNEFTMLLPFVGKSPVDCMRFLKLFGAISVWCSTLEESSTSMV